MTDFPAFIRSHTMLVAPPLVPEVRLWTATEITPLWEATEGFLEKVGIEPPFWAFAWPGSQGLARFLLDNPDLVAGRRVLDVGSGNGLAAIAAAKAGADVTANDVDALALEDVQPADIEAEAALFVEGLGLDSIDALELAMALEERYGVKIGDDPERNQQIFASVRNLASFVSENRVN